jgi:AraC-like DNA-binding protein
MADVAGGQSVAQQNSSLLRIAEEVGYQTDTAFSRAFRREFGSPPAAWRRSQENRTAH